MSIEKEKKINSRPLTGFQLLFLMVRLSIHPHRILFRKEIKKLTSNHTELPNTTIKLVTFIIYGRAERNFSEAVIFYTARVSAILIILINRLDS